MSEEQDKIFFRNYSIVLGILAVMIIVFLIAANVLGKNEALMAERQAEQISERTRPVGDVRVAGEEEQEAAEEAAEPEQEVAAAGPKSGKEVYNGLCVSCHGTGLPGSPQMGNPDDWTDRIVKGKDTLYDHAINGFTGPEGHLMPARGGNPALSDEEVKNAVDYMLANSQ
ncbi:MAG: c-type cytochrome [Gammaproteobacteria bacterium]